MSTPPPPPTTTTNIATVTTPSPTTTLASLATPSSTIGKTNSPSKSIFSSHRDPPKSLRGLNKPKCSQCGNVARSRCPFLSCKSCCAKAQNPCPIHVLKQIGTIPDKPPTSTTSSDQKPTDASSPGTSLRVSSFRQLSQFNGTQAPFRARRPLTRKDAATLNQWRFSKLKEYKESNIEAENEAFDRYMQNISLLEEAFLVDGSRESSFVDAAASTNKDENMSRMILGFKAQLRSNPIRLDNFRKRIQEIVNQGLRKLRKDSNEETTDADDLNGPKEAKKQKTHILRAERVAALDDLIDKLNKVRNEEELQACVEMKTELFNQHEKVCSTEKSEGDASMEQTSEAIPRATRESDDVLPRLWNKVAIDLQTLHTVDTHFSSLDQIEDL